MRSLYLWVDILSILAPFLFSFHPRLMFYKEWKHVLPGIFITALLFIVWDIYYTSLGVWGFNPKYLLGIKFYNLPIEEILFFICIPYACLFSYHCLAIIFPKDYLRPYQQTISKTLAVLCAIVAILNSDKLYTAAAFGLLSVLIIYFEYLIKSTWLSRFYFTYIFLMIPFLIVNGILTGTGIESPIVWYNPNEFMGFRIITIPLEDVFYGMSMLMLSIAISKKLSTKQLKNI